MSKSIRYSMIVLALSIGSVSIAANPFIGHWALTIPGGGAGWLGVEQDDGQLKTSILWGGGSVVPVSRAKIKGDILILERDHKRKRRDGKVDEYTETIIAEVSGDELTLTQIIPPRDGQGERRSEFTGKRIPLCRLNQTFRK